MIRVLPFLIQVENKLKKILEYEQKGKAGGRVISTTIIPIYDFEIFFNKFDNSFYLTVIFKYFESYISSVRDIKIL